MEDMDIETDGASPLSQIPLAVTHLRAPSIANKEFQNELRRSPIQQPTEDPVLTPVYSFYPNKQQKNYEAVISGGTQRNFYRTQRASSGEPIRHYIRETQESLVNNIVTPPQTENPRNTQHQRPQAASAPNPPADINEETGISFERPKYPDYAIIVKRERSFKDWPKDFYVKSEDLVEAGFFLPALAQAGNHDTVCCYYCGQGLNDWDISDRPWTEHARWSPKCTHILNIKGSQFVKEVQENFDNPQKLQEIDRKYSQQKPSTSNTELDSSSAVEAHVVDELIECPAAQHLVNFMGIEEKQIKQAVLFIIKRNSGKAKSFTAVELMEIVLDIQDGQCKEDLEELERAYMKSKKRDLTVDCEPNSDNTTASETTVRTRSPSQTVILKENESLKEQLRCKVCLEKNVCIVFLPCGHLCCCADCASAVRNCPICRKFIKGTVKTYMA